MHNSIKSTAWKGEYWAIMHGIFGGNGDVRRSLSKPLEAEALAVSVSDGSCPPLGSWLSAPRLGIAKSVFHGVAKAHRVFVRHQLKRPVRRAATLKLAVMTGAEIDRAAHLATAQAMVQKEVRRVLSLNRFFQDLKQNLTTAILNN
jgi:hypothetical protein